MSSGSFEMSFIVFLTWCGAWHLLTVTGLIMYKTLGTIVRDLRFSKWFHLVIDLELRISYITIEAQELCGYNIHVFESNKDVTDDLLLNDGYRELIN